MASLVMIFRLSNSFSKPIKLVLFLMSYFWGDVKLADNYNSCPKERGSVSLASWSANLRKKDILPFATHPCPHTTTFPHQHNLQIPPNPHNGENKTQ
jgi:hypothetical protein